MCSASTLVKGPNLTLPFADQKVIRSIESLFFLASSGQTRRLFFSSSLRRHLPGRVLVWFPFAQRGDACARHVIVQIALADHSPAADHIKRKLALIQKLVD